MTSEMVENKETDKTQSGLDNHNNSQLMDTKLTIRDCTYDIIRHAKPD